MDEYRLNKRGLINVIESPVDFISVDHTKCMGCLNCVIICGMDLWKMRDGKSILSRTIRNSAQSALRATPSVTLMQSNSLFHRVDMVSPMKEVDRVTFKKSDLRWLILSPKFAL